MKIVTREQWFAVHRLDDGVQLIHEPYVRPFYRCNMWHVQGRERDVLIDSGSGLVSLREQLPWLTEKPLLAVASHTHFDHIGCHHEFPCRLCHAAEADFLANPTRTNTLATHTSQPLSAAFGVPERTAKTIRATPDKTKKNPILEDLMRSRFINLTFVTSSAKKTPKTIKKTTC